MARRSNDIQEDDRLLLFLRVIGLLFVICGFVVSVIQ